MGLSPKLQLKQSQSLVMTPQLQQAIKLLQFSNMELMDYVGEEVERNPLLEVGDNQDNSPADSNAGEAGAADNREDQARDDRRHEGEDGEKAASNTGADELLAQSGLQDEQGDAPLDTNYDNVFNHDSPGDQVDNNRDTGPGFDDMGSIRVSGRNDLPEQSFEQNLSGNISLQDHIEEQMNLEILDPTERIIARYMLDMLSEAGYLQDDVESIAARLECDVAQVEVVLKRLQGLDPVGVFARDLSECLKLQQAERDRLDPAMEAFLDNLDLLAKRDMRGLMRVCRVDQDDLKDMIAEIQTLNPKPGLAFGGETVQTLIPDVIVKKTTKGSWTVELNNDALPRVLLNRHYHLEIKGLSKSKEEKEFLSECLTSANWLVKALDQRARTILKVASELVRQQEDFFEKGIRFLRPMNLRMIAEAIDMHESTVSRVTSNKYIATNRGIFEMKYFFTSAIASSDEGEAHSAGSVKHQIRELIDAEDVKKILSDDKIVELLRSEGIDIARRTVAKYREAMRIPSSVQRRREKKAAL
ncbi:MAG: RNA polymerase sigma-54 factor [Kordiimonas sp.]|nr:RNA polymerase sigma-54 factor [Kordiimonas sp.]